MNGARFIVDRTSSPDDLYARMSPSRMKQMGLESGSIVCVKSIYQKDIFVAVYPFNTEEDGSSFDSPQDHNLQLSRVIRVQINAYLGQQILVIPYNDSVPVAQSVILAPIFEKIYKMAGPFDFQDLFTKKNQYDFTNVPLSKGTIIPIHGLQHTFEFIVAGFTPDNGNQAVVVKDEKVIKVNGKQMVNRDNSWYNFNNGTVSYDDVGGMKNQLKQIRQSIELPLIMPNLADPSIPKHLLITAQTGMGKTYLAKAIQTETPTHFIYVSGMEILSRQPKEASEFLKNVLREASNNEPSIIYFDDIDALFIDNRLSKVFPHLFKLNRTVLIGTARDGSLPQLQLFKTRINIPIPSFDERCDVVRCLTLNSTLSKSTAIREIAAENDGKTPSVLADVCYDLALRGLEFLLATYDINQEFSLARLQRLVVGKEKYVVNESTEDSDIDHFGSSIR